jgi:hydroxymethylpyrimidine pyrophosphatase-like HAD family hydrolase
MYKPNKIAEKRFLFLDIDGVITPTHEFIPDIPPQISEESIKLLREFVQKGFKLVFITARSSVEIRTRNGVEETLKKFNLLDDSLIYASSGIEHVTYAHEFHTKNDKLVFKNGNAVIKLKPVIKRETFAHLDQLMLYKMFLGNDIRNALKYEGFKLRSAREKRLLTDARFFFELEENNTRERKRMTIAAIEITKRLTEAFKKTHKYGSPVELDVIDIGAGIAIEPKEMGKHLGVLRALKKLEVMPKDKIIAYAFGDSESDRLMKIRNDINFIKVKNNKQFLKIAKEILKKY